MFGDIRAIKKDCAATYCEVVAHHHACKQFLIFLEQSAKTEPQFRRQHVIRDKSVRFLKGYSGNAGGRPKDEHNIAALARSYSIEAIETLVELMRNARDDRVRGTAAQALLDRGFGKPKVEIQNTNADFRDALGQVQIALKIPRNQC